ncbi:hypothetical protein CspeluHIS016_0405260 [Cutaneotrichosporon spelunceum]|uniref:Uncharacterized protein n=1 Tax=Cutaneotrichosporon spelunceum TaxID=1672016 RepID=A0AAD3TVJ5_9TREE|nr:hypothetical protein CspeluHIS016_0405260 [Cutaneotrichosporon spelunceum]
MANPSTHCQVTSKTTYIPTIINLNVEDADYARAFTEALTHPDGTWPSPADLATIDRLTSEPERRKAVVGVLKNRLGAGGECAARALHLIPGLPFSALADLGSEIVKLADGTSWADHSTRAHAAFYLPQVAEAKADRDAATAERKWETWQTLYGRSWVAWLPPPDDSGFTYSKLPEVECPKNPPGWRFVMFPEPFMRCMETGRAYPWRR